MDILGRITSIINTKQAPQMPRFHFVLEENSGLIALPENRDLRQISISYDLLAPYARAQIRWSDVDNSLVYRVSEPSLDEREQHIYDILGKGLVELVDVQLTTIKNPRKAIDYLEEKVWKIIEETDLVMDKATYNKVMYFIYRNFVGLNKIEPFMHDPYIEDIGCVGYNTPVYVVHKRYGSMPTDVIYTNENELKEFVIKMAERCGRYVSYAEPLLDGTLPDGSRVQASLAEDVTTKGPTFSLRKFTKEPLSPIQLMELGTASAEVMAYLWFLMEQGVSVLIVGGTSTGKTTLLNAISMFIPEEDKIVSIEDTRELQLPHKNWIPAVARLGFGAPEAGGERYGEVDMFDLLRESFRQNPDYVIVGEVRGKEAYVMFQGMASGHPSIGTMHAAGVDTVIKRLMSPPIELSPSLVEILDIIVTMVYAQEKGKSSRRIKTISEIQAVEPTGSARTSTAFRWVPATDGYEGGEETYVLNKLGTTKGMSISDIRTELRSRAAVLRWMQENRVLHWKDVTQMISRYHKDANGLLEETGLKDKGYASTMLQSAPHLAKGPGQHEVLGEEEITSVVQPQPPIQESPPAEPPPTPPIEETPVISPKTEPLAPAITEAKKVKRKPTKKSKPRRR